jgi:uncharacterized protein YjiS (DUF1127 family)
MRGAATLGGRRNVIPELSGYSDHELHDIGIHRADIREIARQTSQDQQ